MIRPAIEGPDATERILDGAGAIRRRGDPQVDGLRAGGRRVLAMVPMDGPKITLHQRALPQFYE